jgi:DnaK suppressor protein
MAEKRSKELLSVERLREVKQTLKDLLERAAQMEGGQAPTLAIDFSSDGDSFVDMAQDVASQGDKEAVLEVLRRELKEIDLAIQKAEQGTYGVCDDCGQPIPPERLELMPEATLCVACQTRRERAWFGAR